MSIEAITLIALLAQAPAVQTQAPSQDHAFRAGIVTLAAVTGGDIATTAQAAERGGYTEANPVFRKLFKQPAALGVANGALSAGVGLMAYDLHRKGHRRIAKVIVYGWAIVRGIVVVRNIQALRR